MKLRLATAFIAIITGINLASAQSDCQTQKMNQKWKNLISTSL